MQETTINLTSIKNFIELDVSTQLLFIILQSLRSDGTVELGKPALSKYLKVSPQTVGKKLLQYVNANIIKYKYSGRMFVNPDFCYKGTMANRENVAKAYVEFKSDI